jgi:uncharacterized protein YkwD
MKVKNSFPNPFLKLSIFTILLLGIFSFNSFAQIGSKDNKVSFQTVAAVNEKTEIARPRVVESNKEKSDVDTKSENIAPQTILVTSAAVINQLERKAFDILNEKRKENGLPPVVWSEDMAKVARLHSENMAKFKFFSHAGLDGSMVSDRADSLGFSRWKAIGENIAYNRGYENPVEFACQRWMQSQSHRENILNPRWKEAGLGMAITAEGVYYFTEVFVLR